MFYQIKEDLMKHMDKHNHHCRIVMGAETFKEFQVNEIKDRTYKSFKQYKE